MKIYTLGHKIPDSDSICSAISLAYLLNQISYEATPARQGELNPESKFILDRFGFDEPILKTSYKGENIYLTDHSDLAQAPDDIGQSHVVGIVDHHKLGDITTNAPLECWIRPVGCTNTIIKQMYDFYHIDIPKDIASIMACAILSDTVMFKSPTCTKEDKKALNELAKIANIDDPMALGLEMFKVKSAVEGTPIRELVLRDFKDFNMSDYKVGIGQLEVVDISLFDKIEDDLFKDIEKLRLEGDRDSVLLLLTDIMKEGSKLLVSSKDESKIEKAFDKKLQNSRVWLEGVLSRKKQVVPFLEKSYSTT